MYFIYKLVYFGRKRKKLRYNESEENFHLRYRYKTEYYKYALMLAISVIELIIFAIICIFKPLIDNLTLDINHITHLTQNILDVIISNTVHSLQNVATVASFSLINILTIFMSYVCRSYTEFSPIKRKLRNTIILVVILILLTQLTIIGSLLTQWLAIVIATYEYIQIIKNSKQLYNLLENRNEQLLSEDYLAYQKQKKLVKRYKWYTIFNLVALIIFICVSLLSTLNYLTVIIIFLLGFDSNENLTTIIESGMFQEAQRIILLIITITALFSLGIFSINIIWISLAHAAENLNYTISGLCRKRKKDITERLLS